MLLQKKCGPKLVKFIDFKRISGLIWSSRPRVFAVVQVTKQHILNWTGRFRPDHQRILSKVCVIGHTINKILSLRSCVMHLPTMRLVLTHYNLSDGWRFQVIWPFYYRLAVLRWSLLSADDRNAIGCRQLTGRYAVMICCLCPFALRLKHRGLLQTRVAHLLSSPLTMTHRGGEYCVTETSNSAFYYLLWGS